jgi:hypothetical protein
VELSALRTSHLILPKRLAGSEKSQAFPEYLLQILLIRSTNNADFDGEHGLNRVPAQKHERR